ncbi:cytochrome c oxidase accessory protein CcoG [Shewanella surugensis]|uniref:Cytochrome c oxidase accessory protein CcoG n=1 Tax=Shewanella surugensis TaxID=212020 RepID=A0ABT0L9Z3_9GAMM|nr:cytochrome c oxidase accessory protein CcoG [Shewanella surugensis]MCL1124508.1 cytochrome c oxidase accessory protein CcoG [Shewanella surugensis]
MGERITITQISSPSSKIHIREQKGYFQRIRTTMNSLLVLLFLFTPFISYQGRQAILFNISEQQFIFFGTTLWPQDFTILAWIFIAAAFILFFATVFWGRVWCGFLCPQTAWTFMFVWVETRLEGSRNQRITLDKAPWSFSKFYKRAGKHLLWGIIALLTGCSFIAYFIPARTLYPEIFTFSANVWSNTWVWFFALCTYLNAGWMREQMCLHCCPYSRFQSVMFDANTKTVTYDTSRGESRGPRKRKQATDLGDCVDCHLCVDVCPTGIDIRNGLQYECINCGACIDACNQAMEKFDYAPNLISYISENSLQNETKPIFTSLKFIGYGVASLIMLAVIMMDIASRDDIQLNVIRDRQNLYRETLDSKIENSYTLKIRNKTQERRHYQISIDNQHIYQLVGDTQMVILPGEQLDYPVTVLAKLDRLISSRSPVNFTIREVSTLETKDNWVSQASNFFSPL